MILFTLPLRSYLRQVFDAGMIKIVSKNSENEAWIELDLQQMTDSQRYRFENAIASNLKIQIDIVKDYLRSKKTVWIKA
jgi:hypothetical protein